MTRLLSISLLLAMAFSAPAFAASHKEAPDMANMAKGASAPMASKQQSKMRACNKQAADRKGADRKAFMKTCLSA